jgi:hypothetical protein
MTGGPEVAHPRSRAFAAAGPFCKRGHQMGMSIRGYAKARGVAPKTVRYAIAKRLIVLDADGKVDVEQADSTWGRLRRVREVNTEKQHEESQRNTSARIAAAAAKLRLAKLRFDAEQSRYVDRVAALKVGAYEAEYFLAALAAAPAAHVDRLLARLDVSPEIGREILDRYIERILTEVGDLRDEALRAVAAL